MMTRTPRSLAGVAAVLLGMAWPAAALAANRGGDDTVRGFVAAGPAVAPDYEGSDAYRLLPFGALRLAYRGYSVQARGPGLAADLWPGRTIRLGPVVRYRGGRDDVDDDAVDALRDVDAAVEVGGEIGVAVPAGLRAGDRIGAGITLTQDVADGHGGTLVAASASYDLPVGSSLRASLGASGTWASGAYQDTYFTIDANNAARSGLDRFDADAGLKDVGLSLGLRYAVTKRWAVIGRVAYTRLTGDAADSPVTADAGSPDQVFAGVGIGYRF